MMREDDDGQRATAFFIAGQLAAGVERWIVGVKPFDVELFPDGYPQKHPTFVIQFRESALRYRVSVEPDGRAAAAEGGA